MTAKGPFYYGFPPLFFIMLSLIMGFMFDLVDITFAGYEGEVG